MKGKRGGSETQGVAIRTKKVAVNPIDKPLIETYRALLDNPSTRGAAIEALDMVRQLEAKL